MGMDSLYLVLIPIFIFFSFAVVKLRRGSAYSVDFIPSLIFLALTCVLGYQFSLSASISIDPVDYLVSTLDSWSRNLPISGILAIPLSLLKSLLDAIAQGLYLLNSYLPSPLWFTFAFSSLLLGLYVLLKSAMAFFYFFIHLIIKLWRFILRKKSVSKPSLILPSKLHRTFLKPAIGISLIILSIVLLLIPFWAVKEPSASYFTALVWVGVWVFALELYALLLNEMKLSKGKLNISSEGDGAQRVSQLMKLNKQYHEDFGDALLFSRDQVIKKSKNNTQTDGTAGMLPQWLREVVVQAQLDLDQGKDVVIPEELGQAHLLWFCSLVAKIVNEQGQVLLVCPDDYAKDFKRAFDEVLAERHLRIAFHIQHLAPQVRLDTETVDMLICAPEDIDRLINAEELFDFRLLLVLELQDMDLALLRHELGRLWLQYDADEVKKVFHSQGMRFTDEGVRTISSTRKGLTEHRFVRIPSGDRYLLIWDAEKLRKKLMAYVLPNVSRYFTATPLLGYLHSSDPFHIAPPPVWIDSDYLADLDQVEHLNAQTQWSCLIEQGPQLLRKDNPVHIVEDGANAFQALMESEIPERDQTLPRLLHIVSGNYLLRHLMIKQVEANNLDNDLFRPVLPQVRGNIRDLALQILRALRGGYGLKKNDAKSLLQHFDDPDLLLILGITASIDGLKILFDKALSLGEVEIACSGDGYKVSMSHGLKETYDVRAPGGDYLGKLSVNDYGLVWSENVHLLLTGKSYLVNNHAGGQVNVTHVEDEAPTNYIADRDYQLFIQSTRASEASSRGSNGEHSFVMESHQVNIKRTTRGYVKLRHMTGFQGYDGYLQCTTPITVERQWCNLLCIRMESVSVDVSMTPRLAFTLSTILQDALLSLFPSCKANLAVMATPGWGGVFNEMDAAYQLEGVLRMYPRIEIDISDKNQNNSICLYLLEDCDGDLGVVFSVQRHVDDFLAIMLEYLEDIEGKESEESYHLHKGKIPEYFDYESASTFLKAFVPDHLRRSPDGIVVRKKPRKQERLAYGDCDFCGQLLGIDFDQLADGRNRCLRCSKDAIKGENLPEVQELLHTVLDNMRKRYGFEYRESIAVKIVSADVLAQSVGYVFVPGDGVDPRAVGVAIQSESGFTILIENGSPRASFIMTASHELTHIWQYENAINLNDSHTELVEGQATLIELDYARSFGYRKAAEGLERSRANAKDLYYRGLQSVRKFCGDEPPHMWKTIFLKMLK